jgi:hypothetical protein
MCWKKKQIPLKSEEFIELRQEVNKLKVAVASLDIDLQLYVRKLRASKGLSKKGDEETETENNNKPVILPT